MLCYDFLRRRALDARTPEPAGARCGPAEDIPKDIATTICDRLVRVESGIHTACLGLDEGILSQGDTKHFGCVSGG